MRITCGVLLSLIIFAGSSSAQTVGASLRGAVNDPSGAVVPGASVEIHSTEKGSVRMLTTDNHGLYHEPVLLPGAYEVRVVAAGFKTVVVKNIVLTIGQDAVLDVKLEIAQASETVSVTAETPAINLVSSALSGTVERGQMNDLPLNGRSFQQLALLQPGVNAAVAAGSDVVGGRGQKITINGARPEQNSFLLDGSDINNVYNKTPGSVGGVLLGVDTVQEFQVLTNAYSAEFGRSSGGIINAITRSGSNQVHGNLFEYLRNSKLDAKNFFDPVASPIPAFKRNQFGATLGAPLHRDKTFFFGAFEANKERLGVTGITNVPDDNARLGILPGRAPLALHPLIPQYLDLLFPRANGSVLGGGVAQYLFSRSQPTDEYFAQGRFDHRFSDRDSVFARYTFDNGNVNRQPRDKPPIVFTKERSRNQYLTLEHGHTFSAALLNTLRLSYSRSTSEADNQRTVDVPPALWWIPGSQFGYMTIQGLITEMAGDYRLPRNDHLNNYQWHDTLFWTKGAHGLRFGTEGQRMLFNQHTTSQYGGIAIFNSLPDFLTGTPAQVNFAVPGLIDPDRGFRESLYAFFVQDDYRWKPNLTFNIGLRYEFATVPTEANGKITNLRKVTDPSMTIGDPWHSNPSLKDFAPRVGLAWDPFHAGKTSVRAGFGMFYDQILPKHYIFSGSLNPPFTTRTSIRPPLLSFPNALANFNFNAPIIANLQPINFDLQPSYIMQYNFSVQHSLPNGWDVTLGYAGSRGVHLIQLGDANLAPETIVNGVKTYQPALGRRNPKFGGITQRKTDANSFYNSFQAGAVKRLSHGLRAQFSYTFSRSIDEASGINSQDFDNSTQYALDWYDRKADRGLSSFSAKHVFVTNWSYELPFGRNKTGAAGVLMKGWQLNNIITAQSGTPFEARLGFNRSGNLNTIDFSIHERPDVAPGKSNNPVTGDPRHWFDASAFVLQPANRIGNLGRNTIIGPKLVSFDLSVFKEIALSEKRSLQFRAEAFNILNHPNFSVPNQANRTALNPPPASDPNATVVNGSAGTITTTVTTSRQIQFGLKFAF